MTNEVQGTRTTCNFTHSHFVGSTPVQYFDLVKIHDRGPQYSEKFQGSVIVAWSRLSPRSNRSKPKILPQDEP